MVLRGGAARSNLFAVGGQQVEAACRDGQADCHAGKLQVALSQDGGQTSRGGLQKATRVDQKTQEKQNPTH